MLSLEKKTVEYMDALGICREKGILAAVSGGADSVALLRILAKASEREGFPLFAMHVHHGIRETADRDAAFTEALCRSLSVPCRVAYVDAPEKARERGLTLEEAAREERYRVLRAEREARGCGYIAVAHHGDDQAETVLMHILRGTSLRGLRGILPVNSDLIRPLLFSNRYEIEEYLAACGASFVTDETNFDLAHTRNVVRLRLLPAMEKENPDIRQQLIRLGESARVIYRDMEKRLPALEEKLDLKREPGKVSFLAEEAGKLPKGFLYEIIFTAFETLAGGRKDFSRVHAREVEELIRKETGKKVSLPEGLTARRSYERIVVEQGGASEANRKEKLSVEILPREAVENISKKTYTKMVDYDKIKNSLCIRTPEPGDRIAVYSDGRTQKLGRFFTNEKVEEASRKNWPVVADGKDIVWIVGLRLSKAYMITEETKKIAVLSLSGEDQ